MQSALRWQVEKGELAFHGTLDRDTLLPFWHSRQQILNSEIRTINVASLTRIDSAGLAMLLHILEEATQQQRPLQLRGVTEKLRTLSTLYNLWHIIEPFLVDKAAA